MITSRTGEKHRERAMAIGVNDYLGKPYQESLLLESIQHLVKRT
jgi:chemosensory pili system protein ChpA (sensor histidine kinase/response regulator)